MRLVNYLLVLKLRSREFFVIALGICEANTRCFHCRLFFKPLFLSLYADKFYNYKMANSRAAARENVDVNLIVINVFSS